MGGIHSVSIPTICGHISKVQRFRVCSRAVIVVVAVKPNSPILHGTGVDRGDTTERIHGISGVEEQVGVGLAVVERDAAGLIRVSENHSQHAVVRPHGHQVHRLSLCHEPDRICRTTGVHVFGNVARTGHRLRSSRRSGELRAHQRIIEDECGVVVWNNFGLDHICQIVIYPNGRRSIISDPEVPVPPRPPDVNETGLREVRGRSCLSRHQREAIRLISHAIRRGGPCPDVLDRVSRLHSVSLRVKPSLKDWMQRIARPAIGIEVVSTGGAAVFDDHSRNDWSLQPVPEAAVGQHRPCTCSMATRPSPCGWPATKE